MPKIKTLAATALVSLLGLVACQPQPARPMTDEQWRATVTYAAAVEDARWRAIVEYAAAVEAARLHALQRPACTGPGHGSCQIEGIEVCNGRDLPTCGIVWRESRFIAWARNARSSAAGLYQFLVGTFRGVCPAEQRRYGSAANAPVGVQVHCARLLWAGGRGAGHWRLTA